jgi:folylpolyglutamate synthase/dihydropteroate synthase
MEILGKTLSEISSQKAGIIKNNVPIVTIDQSEEILTPMINEAKIKNSPFIISPTFEEYEKINNIKIDLNASGDVNYFLLKKYSFKKLIQH